MTQSQLYFYIENLGLNNTQRDTLVDWFKEFNSSNSPYPNRNMQIRKRLDNQAIIFESYVNVDNLDRDHVLNRLASLFEIDPSTITVVIRNNQYGQGADFERPEGTPRLRFGVFGGINATTEESASACRAYLTDNLAQWQEQL